MKREDLRVLRCSYGSVDCRLPECSHTLTDAEALRLLLFDVCGECEGSRYVVDDAECRQDCPACAGSGWEPKMPVLTTALQPGSRKGYWLPASMLDPEGDTDV